MTDIKAMLAKYEELLPTNNSLSVQEAEFRAGEFLAAQATIANIKHMLGNEKIQLLSIQTAVYAQELAKGTAKTMTENKVTAEASPEYTKAREEFERIENDISYLRTYGDIFMAAHVFYRKLGQGDIQ